jgi:hypothetical protein
MAYGHKVSKADREIVTRRARICVSCIRFPEVVLGTFKGEGGKRLKGAKDTVTCCPRCHKPVVAGVIVEMAAPMSGKAKRTA